MRKMVLEQCLSKFGPKIGAQFEGGEEGGGLMRLVEDLIVCIQTLKRQAKMREGRKKSG